MYQKIRIVFSIVSALCASGVILGGILGGWIPALVLIGCTVLFFLPVLYCKRKQDQQEAKENPPVYGDFFHPLPTQTQSLSPADNTAHAKDEAVTGGDSKTVD